MTLNRFLNIYIHGQNSTALRQFSHDADYFCLARQRQAIETE